jgi:hypothetical protein
MKIYSHGGLDCNRYEAKQINRLVVLRLLGHDGAADKLAEQPVFSRLAKRGVISLGDEISFRRSKGRSGQNDD